MNPSGGEGYGPPGQPNTSPPVDTKNMSDEQFRQYLNRLQTWDQMLGALRMDPFPTDVEVLSNEQMANLEVNYKEVKTYLSKNLSTYGSKGFLENETKMRKMLRRGETDEKLETNNKFAEML